MSFCECVELGSPSFRWRESEWVCMVCEKAIYQKGVHDETPEDEQEEQPSLFPEGEPGEPAERESTTDERRLENLR